MVSQLEPAVWIRPRADLTLLRLRGADASPWLQGQITQDIRTITADQWSLAFLVKPTGQLLASLEIRADDGAFLILTGQPQAFLDRVEAMVILEEVSVQVVALPILTTFGINGHLPTTWCPGVSHQIAGPSFAGTVLGDEEWECLLALNSIPIFGIDTDQKTLPPELGRFAQRGISYDKGCYTGQEVLMRIFSRGHVNRRWLTLFAEGEVLAGSAVVAEGKEVGRVHRAHPIVDGSSIVTTTIPTSTLTGVLTSNGIQLRPNE